MMHTREAQERSGYESTRGAQERSGYESTREAKECAYE